MVLKKRQEYGFRGYQAPAIPRAPRSVRRRASFKKPVDSGQLCAFELLAAVAVKLLQEGESSNSSNVAEVKEHIEIINAHAWKSTDSHDFTIDSSDQFDICIESRMLVGWTRGRRARNKLLRVRVVKNVGGGEEMFRCREEGGNYDIKVLSKLICSDQHRVRLTNMDI